MISRRRKFIFCSLALALLFALGIFVFLVFHLNENLNESVFKKTFTDKALNDPTTQAVTSPVSSILNDKMARGVSGVGAPRNNLQNQITNQNPDARLQGTSDYAKAFRASILSADYAEAAAAKRLHVFCMSYSPRANITFEQWYVEDNAPLDKVGAPAGIAAALESERKILAKTVFDRCSGFTNGTLSTDEARRLNLQATKNHPRFSEIGSVASATLSGIAPASSLALGNPLFGSNEPYAYDALLRYAKPELALPISGNERVNNLSREYVAAIALCSNDIDCSPSGITFAQVCINWGACKGVSVEDALREALRGHNVSTESLDSIGYALSQWLAGKGTWAQLMPPVKKKA